MPEIAKKAVIVGGTSGIGKALAEVLIDNGYIVGLTGRRGDMLAEISQKHGNSVLCQSMDVDDPEKAAAQLENITTRLGGMDLIVISAGTGIINPELSWEHECKTIATNVNGFAAIATCAMRYFLKQGHGHLVGISSIAAIRGSSEAPAYNASKAFVANYLEGLHVKARKSGLPIFVTDIMPGFVDTAMAQGPGLFWVASPQKAALQIFTAIQKKKRHAYITSRWCLIAWIIRLLPDFLYYRL